MYVKLGLAFRTSGEEGRSKMSDWIPNGKLDLRSCSRDGPQDQTPTFLLLRPEYPKCVCLRGEEAGEHAKQWLDSECHRTGRLTPRQNSALRIQLEQLKAKSKHHLRSWPVSAWKREPCKEDVPLQHREDTACSCFPHTPAFKVRTMNLLSLFSHKNNFLILIPL